MEYPHEGSPPHPKDEALFRRIDSVLAEETIILEGLTKAVSAGRITEGDKAEWLNEYIQKRGILNPDMINEDVQNVWVRGHEV